MREVRFLVFRQTPRNDVQRFRAYPCRYRSVHSIQCQEKGIVEKFSISSSDNLQDRYFSAFLKERYTRPKVNVRYANKPATISSVQALTSPLRMIRMTVAVNMSKI